VPVWASPYENLLSTAERRALEPVLIKQPCVCLTLWDYTFHAGKVGIGLQEGEQEGAAYVAQNLIGSAIHTFSPAIS
jgi:magnesium chelatase subunit I